MPLVRISLREGTSPEYRQALADGVHRAMLESIAVPSGDRFQVITQHPPGDLIYSPDYLGVSRSDRVVFVQITMSTGRKPQQKRALFKRMAEILSESPGLRPEDLLISLVEVSWENWSFGDGQAQYMDTWSLRDGPIHSLSRVAARFPGPVHPALFPLSQMR